MCDEYIQVLSLFWSVLQLSHGDHHSDCVCVFLGGRVLAGLFIGGTELGIFYMYVIDETIVLSYAPSELLDYGMWKLLAPYKLTHH